MELPEDDPWSEEYDDALDYFTDTDEPDRTVIRPVLVLVIVGTVIAIAIGLLLWGPS
jgi:hypothetical protein